MSAPSPNTDGGPPPLQGGMPPPSRTATASGSSTRSSSRSSSKADAFELQQVVDVLPPSVIRRHSSHTAAAPDDAARHNYKMGIAPPPSAEHSDQASPHLLTTPDRAEHVAAALHQFVFPTHSDATTHDGAHMEESRDIPSADLEWATRSKPLVFIPSATTGRDGPTTKQDGASASSPSPPSVDPHPRPETPLKYSNNNDTNNNNSSSSEVTHYDPQAAGGILSPARGTLQFISLSPSSVEQMAARSPLEVTPPLPLRAVIHGMTATAFHSGEPPDVSDVPGQNYFTYERSVDEANSSSGSSTRMEPSTPPPPPPLADSIHASHGGGESPNTATTVIPITVGDRVGSTNNNANEDAHDDLVVDVLTAVPRRPMTADELQAARWNYYEEACTVSTLDFLKETNEAVMPDAVQSMFTATSSFFRRGTQAVHEAMPQPIRHAARKTGRGVALMAEFTGDILTNVPEYVALAIPDALLSQETKQIVFNIDFLRTLHVVLDINILAVPFIFRMGGLVGGLLLLTVMHAVSYYATVAFFGAKNQLRDVESVVMYGDVPRLTWGKWFPLFSLWYGAFFLLAFVSYASSNTFVLVGAMGLGSGGDARALSFIAPILFPLPFIFMKRAKSQAPLDTITTVLVLVSVILYMVIFPYRTPHYNLTGTNSPHLWPADVGDFFVAMSVTLYVACPLRTAVPIERGMQPERFIRLLGVAVVLAYAAQVAFGLAAFISLGSGTCAVLPSSLHSGSVAIAASSLLFFAFVAVIASTAFRMMEFCDRRVLGLRQIPTYWQSGPNLMRVAFMTGIAVVAYVLPFYGFLLSFAGAFGCGVIGLMIPGALDYVRRERASLRRGHFPKWYEYVVCVGLVVFGAVVAFGGVLFTLYDVWLVMQTGYKTTC